MSTLMTERRRPPDHDDGQEALFGGDAFAAGPPAPTSWEREHARPAPARGHHELRVDASAAHLPLESAAPAIESEAVPFETAEDDLVGPAQVQTGGREALEAGAAVPAEEEWAPLDESQFLTGYEGGPSAADLAAYDFEVGSAPTEVPAQDAGEELAALERATIVPDGARQARAPLAGPTLDDVMSRAWEGLVTGLSAACPVCDGEVLPSFAGSVHGSCSSCGTTIE
jgi:hypothetical protein